MHVIVCQKNKAHDTVKAHNATHLLCMLDPDDRLFVSPRLEKINRLHLNFEDDINENAPHAPTREHMERILEWGAKLPDDAIVVVNCWAGVSRSTAAAMALMVQKHGDVERAARDLKTQRPQACPNPIMTKHADDILGMGGRLHEKAEEIAKFKMLSLLK